MTVWGIVLTSEGIHEVACEEDFIALLDDFGPEVVSAERVAEKAPAEDSSETLILAQSHHRREPGAWIPPASLPRIPRLPMLDEYDV